MKRFFIEIDERTWEDILAMEQHFDRDFVRSNPDDAQLFKQYLMRRTAADNHDTDELDEIEITQQLLDGVEVKEHADPLNL